jgi:hypothetical protein
MKFNKKIYLHKEKKMVKNVEVSADAKRSGILSKSGKTRNPCGDMKRFSFIFMLIGLLLASCLSISETKKQELLSKGLPIAIVKALAGSPNSAGGVNVYIDWQNISDKEIKYVVFTVMPYNRVNDIAPSDIGHKATEGLRDMGPYKPGQVVSDGYYENVWYNHTIDHLTLRGAEITFMDGEKVVFDADQVSQMLIK